VILPRVFEQPNFELRTNAHVTRVLLDASGSRATGVLYVDAQGRETEQPAEIVILCAYGINNVS
jgi:gluconate 2-dehydrogenase alpha chain